MALEASATFQYVTTVPSNLEEGSSPWPLQPLLPVDHIGDSLHDSRLVGLSPRLTITDGGPTPNPSHSRPAVPRSRITLTAARKQDASFSAASLYVDRDLMRAFKLGDILHIARTGCGGLGISLLRNDALVFGVGAISAVPLGNEVRGSIPFSLTQEAEQLFQESDPSFEFSELPLQISIEERIRITFRGMFRMGSYEIWVEHGFYPGMPGDDECAAISLEGACASAAARATAQLLNGSDLEMTPW